MSFGCITITVIDRHGVTELSGTWCSGIWRMETMVCARARGASFASGSARTGGSIRHGVSTALRADWEKESMKFVHIYILKERA